MKILIVDDELPSRRMFRLALETDHEVHEAGDGASALDVLVGQGPFDVALLDFKMPGMSGLELLSKIHKRWPETAVVMITAYSSLAVAAEAMRAGARHFLSKPTDPHALRAAVAATRRKPQGEITGDAPRVMTTRHQMAVTLNGFTVEPSGAPAQVLPDGSAVHRFRVSNALESWERLVSVRIGPHAFTRSGQRDLSAGSRVAALAARRVLAEHLWREGLLPAHDELVIDELDATQVAEAQQQELEI
jgi:CheY-like chemotaxis protein